jgi:hypothetical protein
MPNPRQGAAHASWRSTRARIVAVQAEECGRASRRTIRPELLPKSHGLGLLTCLSMSGASFAATDAMACNREGALAALPGDGRMLATSTRFGIMGMASTTTTCSLHPGAMIDRRWLPGVTWYLARLSTVFPSSCPMPQSAVDSAGSVAPSTSTFNRTECRVGHSFHLPGESVTCTVRESSGA